MEFNMDIITKIIEIVCEIQQRYPELRFCQIISNAVSRTDWTDSDLFYLPDEKLLEGLEVLKKEII